MGCLLFLQWQIESKRGGTRSSLGMAVVHAHHTRKRVLSDWTWRYRWSRKPAPTSVWGLYGLLGTQQTMGASALCPVATLSLFSMADDCMCRRGSGVFPVWAVTIMLVGCNRDTLGLKRARGRGVGKWGSENRLSQPQWWPKSQRSLLPLPRVRGWMCHL